MHTVFTSIFSDIFSANTTHCHTHNSHKRDHICVRDRWLSTHKWGSDLRYSPTLEGKGAFTDTWSSN